MSKDKSSRRTFV